LTDKAKKESLKNEIIEIEEFLLLFSEHTWGHSESVYMPWTTATNTLEMRNISYANRAHALAYRLLDRLLVSKGDLLISYNRPLTYKIINPHNHDITTIAKLYVDGFETKKIENGFTVIDKNSGKTLFAQQVYDSRGLLILAHINIPANSEQYLEILNKEKLRIFKIPLRENHGSDEITDIEDANFLNLKNFSFMPGVAETSFLKLKWNKTGIYSWYDKANNKELISKIDNFSTLTPVYEFTPCEQYSSGKMCTVRKQMGRNRRAFNTEKNIGILTNAKLIDDGDIYGSLEFSYNLKGTSYFKIILNIHKHQPRVDILVKINKDSAWEPENVYLPFHCRKEYPNMD